MAGVKQKNKAVKELELDSHCLQGLGKNEERTGKKIVTILISLLFLFGVMETVRIVKKDDIKLILKKKMLQECCRSRMEKKHSKSLKAGIG